MVQSLPVVRLHMWWGWSLIKTIDNRIVLRYEVIYGDSRSPWIWIQWCVVCSGWLQECSLWHLVRPKHSEYDLYCGFINNTFINVWGNSKHELLYIISCSRHFSDKRSSDLLIYVTVASAGIIWSAKKSSSAIFIMLCLIVKERLKKKGTHYQFDSFQHQILLPYLCKGKRFQFCDDTKCDFLPGTVHRVQSYSKFKRKCVKKNWICVLFFLPYLSFWKHISGFGNRQHISKNISLLLCVTTLFRFLKNIYSIV